MSLLSLQFVALLLSGVLLGGMLFHSFALMPLVFMRLPAEIASRFARHAFRVYYLAGTVLALLAALAAGMSLAGLFLGVTGVAFLFALLWLMPTINRNRDRGLEGDAAAEAAFKGLHRASVALNTAQMAMVAAAFALLAVLA